jgi:serine/threonine-protein kinase RsbT
VIEQHRIRVRTEGDAAEAARIARELALRQGLSRTEAMHAATAVSEVAVNQVRHARGGGTVMVARSDEGVLVEAGDAGPGIAKLELALRDGWSSGGGLGLGLPGARRLMDRFEISSPPGAGVVVRMAKLNRPEPAPLAVWEASGPGAFTHATTTHLVLGVVGECEAARACADVAAALGDGPGVLAHLSGRDGCVSWIARGGAAGVILRDGVSIVRAPSRRAAEVGARRDDVLVLTGGPRHAGAKVTARVLRGVFERHDRRG